MPGIQLTHIFCNSYTTKNVIQRQLSSECSILGVLKNKKKNYAIILLLSISEIRWCGYMETRKIR